MSAGDEAVHHFYFLCDTTVRRRRRCNYKVQWNRDRWLTWSGLELCRLDYSLAWPSAVSNNDNRLISIVLWVDFDYCRKNIRESIRGLRASELASLNHNQNHHEKTLAGGTASEIESIWSIDLVSSLPLKFPSLLYCGLHPLDKEFGVSTRVLQRQCWKRMGQCHCWL